MDLIAGEESLGWHTESGGHAGAVFRHVARLIPGAHSGIKARVDTARYTAGARKERMPDAGKPRKRVRLERLRHGPNPGSCAICGAENPTTLNSEPIWSGPVPVRRSRAAAMSARWDSVAL